MKVKRISARIVALLLALLMLPIQAALAASSWVPPELNLSATYEASTGKVTATVSIGAHDAVGGIGFSLNYDSTMLTYESHELLGVMVGSIINTAAAGKVSVSGGSDVTVSAVSAGAIMKVVFTVNAGKNGTASFELNEFELNDCADTEVTSTTGTHTANVTIPASAASKPDQTITAADVTATYGATDAKVNATTSGDGAIRYAVKSGSEAYIAVDSTTGVLTIKKAGTAHVTVTAAETDTYAAKTKDVTVTINPKSITPDVTVNVPAEGYTYDGSAKTPDVTVKDGATVLTADQDYTLTYANNTDAGTDTAKVTVTAKDGGNYAWTAVEQSFSIQKANQIIEGDGFNATVGSTVDLSGKFSAKTGLSYEITGENATGSTVSGNTLTVGSTAGSFTLKVSAAATVNYNAASQNFTVTVTTKPSQTIDADNVTATYGDTDAKVTATVTTGNGAISYAVKSGSEEYIDVAADGTLTLNKVGIAYVTVTAAETDEYAAKTQDVKVTINPKAIAAPTEDPRTYTYNGANQTYGMITTADYTVTGGVQKNAGTYSVTAALRDPTNTVWADTSEATNKTFTFEIKKATITITARNKTAYVGNTAPVLGTSDYTVAGLAEGEALKTLPTIAYASTPDMTTTGTVAIQVSGAEAPVGGNYNDIVYVNGTLTITTRPVGGGVSTYAVTVLSSKNGSITADRKTASAGTVVTLTAAPDKGYTLESLTVLDKNNKEIKLTEKSGKYTFTMPAGSVEVKAAFKAANPFTDVPSGSYYEDAVIWAVESGITGGTTATTFNPAGVCTRAQAVTFLWRAAGSPAPKSTAMPFTDVPAGSYYEQAVLWAVENGITQGTGDATFSPAATCSRAQIVTFLWRSQKSPAAGGVNPFADVPADAYYTDAVLWAVKAGVTGGTTATTFSPAADCTRAQIVTLIYRALAE